MTLDRYVLEDSAVKLFISSAVISSFLFTADVKYSVALIMRITCSVYRAVILFEFLLRILEIRVEIITEDSEILEEWDFVLSKLTITFNDALGYSAEPK